MTPKYVYVVSTGGCRFAVESEVPMRPEEAFKITVPRFAELGRPMGLIVEITECSDNADPSDPHYIHTENVLRAIGLWSEQEA